MTKEPTLAECVAFARWQLGLATDITEYERAVVTRMIEACERQDDLVLAGHWMGEPVYTDARAAEIIQALNNEIDRMRAQHHHDLDTLTGRGQR